MDEKLILTPLIQYGFAGLSAILIAFIVWLTGELIKVVKESNRVISANTQAVQAVCTLATDTLRVASDCKEELLKLNERV